MTHIVHYFTALLLILSFAGCSRNEQPPADTPADTLGLLTAQIQQCSRLYTTEYRLHKIVASESNRQIEGAGIALGLGIFGDRKIIIPVNATVKGYIDFSNFSERDVERRDGKLVVTLPDPQVMLTSTKVEQEQIRSYVTGLRNRFSDREMARLEEEGRRAVIRDIPTLHIEQAARLSAVRLLVPLIVQMGYREEDIIVNFRHDFTPYDLIRNLH
mgnify:CR=1 FL=1